MPPFVAFLLGTLVGAIGSAFAPQLQRNARPMLKEAIKAGMILAREAQVRAAEVMEAVEDAYAEAKAEAEASEAISAARASSRRPSPAAAPRKRARATARKTVARRSTRRAMKPATHGHAGEAA